MTTDRNCARLFSEVLQGRPIWTGNAEEHEKPVSDQAGRARDVDDGPVGLSGPDRRRAAGSYVFPGSGPTNRSYEPKRPFTLLLEMRDINFFFYVKS